MRRYTRVFAWVTVGAYCTPLGGEEIYGPSRLVGQRCTPKKNATRADKAQAA